MWREEGQLFFENKTLENTQEFLNNKNNNVNMRCENTRWTLLHGLAQWNDDHEVIEAFLKAGADINVRDNYGCSPLHLAASNNKNSEITKALVGAGADLHVRNQDGWTPLHSATINNTNPEVVIALLDAGADATIMDLNNKIPYDYVNGNQAIQNTDAIWRLADAECVVLERKYYAGIDTSPQT